MGEDGKIIYKVVINDDGAAEAGEAAGHKAGSGLERGAKSGTGAFHEMAVGAFRQIGAAAVNMAKQAADAFVDVTKQALDSVASYEQNIGGVETLFGDSAQYVINNAKQAYQTAGLSANAYMETVTSFSASLLQSLGGDTLAAAAAADRAVIDMSDNANKMGTDMAAIQNAYQGFAKQNYTMLDNLKLGYGGTKTEMERLVSDAEKLDSSFKAQRDANGNLTLSFADVVEAIHLVQTNMGITGTTAEEAATTIEGSMNSAKAAYDNFLNGSISAEDFAGTIKTAAGNIVNNLAEIVTRFSTELPVLIQALGEMLPGLVQTLGPPLFSAVSTLISSLVGLLIEYLPDMASAGVNLLTGLLSGFASSGGLLNALAVVGEVIKALLSAIIENAPQLLEAGVSLLGQLIVGLGQALPMLLEYAGHLVLELFNAFFNADWASIGSNIVQGIQNGISGLWGNLVDSVSNGVTNLWNNAKNALGIASPSKKFKYIGEMSVEGTMEGFEDREAEMNRVVHDVYSGIGETAETTLAPSINGSIGENMERNVSVNMTATGSTDGTYIVVPLTIDGREIARATAWSMGEQLAWEELG